MRPHATALHSMQWAALYRLYTRDGLRMWQACIIALPFVPRLCIGCAYHSLCCCAWRRLYVQVVQEVHVKNRCAWLNHSDRPERFIQLVERYPNTIKLWMSGHFHLSHNYKVSMAPLCKPSVCVCERERLSVCMCVPSAATTR